MGRKKSASARLPEVGEVLSVDWLPRDVKLGLQRRPGELAAGWCEATETYQLWRVVDRDGWVAAEFVGFVVGSPPGGVRNTKRKRRGPK